MLFNTQHIDVFLLKLVYLEPSVLFQDFMAVTINWTIGAAPSIVLSLTSVIVHLFMSEFKLSELLFFWGFFTFVFVLWLVLYESHLWGNGQCARHECGKSWLLIPGQMKPKTIKLVFSATLLSIKE